MYSTIAEQADSGPLQTALEVVDDAIEQLIKTVDAGAVTDLGAFSLVDVLRHRGDAQATVGDAMTEQVLSVMPTTNVSIIAHRMRVYGELRLVPVVDKGVVVGVITRSDSSPGGLPSRNANRSSIRSAAASGSAWSRSTASIGARRYAAAARSMITPARAPQRSRKRSLNS